MDAFALPSFYQGRIRVNLEGRERDGQVPPTRLAAVLDEVEAVLRACRDPRTSQPLVVPADHADLVVYWNGSAVALGHPAFGLVGPVPYRRTGGHTRPLGFCHLSGPGIAPGQCEHCSVSDLAPTIAALAGSPIEGRRTLLEVPAQDR